MAWTLLNWSEDLRILARELLDRSMAQGWIWRGEADLFPGIRPSFDRYADRLRQDRDASAMRALERDYYSDWWWHVLELVQSRDMLGPSRPDGLPELEWLNFAQHHGCKTRLVDWTYSPWVATYFACAPKHAGPTRRVWGFKTNALERALHAEWQRRGLGDATDVGPVLFGGDEGAAPVVCTQYNRRPNSRMAAQRGLFTVASALNVKHDELLDALLADPDDKIEIHIPSSFRPGLLGLLGRMNVDHETLNYPMIDQVAGDFLPGAPRLNG